MTGQRSSAASGPEGGRLSAIVMLEGARNDGGALDKRDTPREVRRASVRGHLGD